MSDVEIPLSEDQFLATDRLIASTSDFQASAFRYPSGVAALRITNRRGEVIFLPFQGQQVWDAQFDGRRLTMKSMFDAPRRTRDFLQTYGGLLIHCGATAVGPPGANDDHPPHGELPNVCMDSAKLKFRDGSISVSGSYRHTVAFQTDYVFRPMLTLAADGAILRADVEIENLKRTEMSLFYLAHINFRASGGVCIQDNSVSLRLREELPSHVKPSPVFKALFARLAADPASHRRIAAEDQYDPEVVLFPEFSGPQAVALAVHPDGTADIIRYATETLPKALRWISRTPDQECLGLVLPATCEGEGRHLETAKGNMKILKAGESFRCRYEFGLLTADEAQVEETQLNS